MHGIGSPLVHPLGVDMVANFSSMKKLLGVKGSKLLAVYDKSTRSWSWIGPVV